MAKPKTVNKISDKLFKVSESFSVNMYDNGFMLEISGRNTNDDWTSAKIMVKNIDELVVLIREAVEMDRE